MRLIPAAFATLGLIALAGCNTSPPGGTTHRGTASTTRTTTADGGHSSTTTTTDTGDKNATFTISAPTLSTHIKEGETQTVKLSLHRGDKFHEDVTLKFDAPKGLKVDPLEKVVKASDKPDDIAVQVSAEKDAPLGDHEVKVTGTPATGAATSVDFKVTVSKP
ncbi:MAG TPA: hypothetical protein VGF55_22820 [Gemmataceae bacterium]|jgi:uncharacterized membrane protein